MSSDIPEKWKEREEMEEEKRKGNPSSFVSNGFISFI